MIVAVAVCPGAPLLVPGLAPALAAAVPDLIRSCAAAAASLRPAGRVLLLTSGPRVRDPGVGDPEATVRHPPGAVVSSSLLTDSGSAPLFSSRLAGTAEPVSGPSGVGVGVVVGVALLDGAGITSPVTAIELGNTPGSVDEDLAALRAAVGTADRVGLLIIGEGSASRGPDSPGGGHGGASAFDAALAAALAGADPGALLRAVTAGLAQAGDLVWTSGPSLGALARLCIDLPPPDAQLLYDAAPFGVGYLVATWTWPVTASSERM